jgi:hypothetical protein
MILAADSSPEPARTATSTNGSVEWGCRAALPSPETPLSRIEIVPPHTYRYYLEEPVTSASRPRPP